MAKKDVPEEFDRVRRLIGGTPSNVPLSRRMTAFTFDHSQQMRIAPRGPFATGSDQESNSYNGKFCATTMNSGGRSAHTLRGVRIGMSPDYAGKANYMGQGTSRQRKTREPTKGK